jgi:signal transduction histidine kinase
MSAAGDWDQHNREIRQAVATADATVQADRFSATARRFLAYPEDMLTGRDFSCLLASPSSVLPPSTARLESTLNRGRVYPSRLPAELAIAGLAERRDLEFLTAIRDIAASKGPRGHVQGAKEISQAILSGRQLDEILQLIVCRARALLGAEAVWVVLTERYHREVKRGQAVWDGMTITPGGTSLCDENASEGSLPTLIADAVAAAWTDDAVMRTARLGHVHESTLMAEGQALGTLYVSYPPARLPVQRQDVEAEKLFADEAALAIRLVEIQRERTRTAAQERERLARDLHDDTVQALYAVTLGLETARSRTRENELKDQLGSLAAVVQTTIEDLQNHIFALRPSVLSGRRLDEALLQLVTDFQLRTGLVTVADVDPAAGQQLAEQATEVIQIVREGLSNIGRHAKAQTCRVSLWLEDGMVRLLMEDDGAGFDPSRPRHDGNGLRNLTERAARLGGRLLIESAPGAGTTLRIDIPLHKARSPE